MSRSPVARGAGSGTPSCCFARPVGTHAELGMALASAENKRILLWSESPAPL
ncbi:MAG: hypothetical protein R2881_06210 [Eubacteriales bacterium]